MKNLPTQGDQLYTDATCQNCRGQFLVQFPTSRYQPDYKFGMSYRKNNRLCDVYLCPLCRHEGANAFAKENPADYINQLPTCPAPCCPTKDCTCNPCGGNSVGSNFLCLTFNQIVVIFIWFMITVAITAMIIFTLNENTYNITTLRGGSSAGLISYMQGSLYRGNSFAGSSDIFSLVCISFISANVLMLAYKITLCKQRPMAIDMEQKSGILAPQQSNITTVGAMQGFPVLTTPQQQVASPQTPQIQDQTQATALAQQRRQELQMQQLQQQQLQERLPDFMKYKNPQDWPVSNTVWRSYETPDNTTAYCTMANFGQSEIPKPASLVQVPTPSYAVRKALQGSLSQHDDKEPQQSLTCTTTGKQRQRTAKMPRLHSHNVPKLGVSKPESETDFEAIELSMGNAAMLSPKPHLLGRTRNRTNKYHARSINNTGRRPAMSRTERRLDDDEHMSTLSLDLPPDNPTWKQYMRPIEKDWLHRISHRNL